MKLFFQHMAGQRIVGTRNWIFWMVFFFLLKIPVWFMWKGVTTQFPETGLKQVFPRTGSWQERPKSLI